MNMNWNTFIGYSLNVVLKERYGLVHDQETDKSLYETVYRSGKLLEAFDDGLLIESFSNEMSLKTYIPYSSIKCVDILKLKNE